MKKDINIVIISNITTEPFLGTLLKREFNEKHIDIQVSSVPYEVLHMAENEDIVFAADIVIFLLNLEILAPDLWVVPCAPVIGDKVYMGILSQCQREISNTLSQAKGKVFWCLFEDYYIPYVNLEGSVGFYSQVTDQLNHFLQEQFQEPNISFVDMKRLIAKIGISSAFSRKNKYRWNMPYSRQLLALLAHSISKQYFAENYMAKKCLILDCDNVLWGGTLLEDGIENIKLSQTGAGREFFEFQKFVLSMYYRGVLLAVCSKNQYEIVLEVFREHTAMVLKEENITYFSVSWRSKTEGIITISEHLGIGLDSMVFVDDSQHEISEIRNTLPEVEAVLYRRDSIFEDLSIFHLNHDISQRDVRMRNETYRTNSERMRQRQLYRNRAEYIEALDMRLDIRPARPNELSRIVELSQRTNKCTNGKRYQFQELANLYDDEDSFLYAVYLSDKFSDLGLVGAIVTAYDTLDFFALSCRALGRGIEDSMMEHLLSRHSISKIFFKETGKNGEIKEKLGRWMHKTENGYDKRGNDQ